MRTLSIVAAVATAIALAPISANAQHRAGEAAMGAIAGAVVAGPIGAVAGGVIGYTAGPRIARDWRFHSRHRHRYARRH
jgi:hypothetical protein